MLLYVIQPRTSLLVLVHRSLDRIHTPLVIRAVEQLLHLHRVPRLHNNKSVTTSPLSKIVKETTHVDVRHLIPVHIRHQPITPTHVPKVPPPAHIASLPTVGVATSDLDSVLLPPLAVRGGEGAAVAAVGTRASGEDTVVVDGDSARVAVELVVVLGVSERDFLTGYGAERVDDEALESLVRFVVPLSTGTAEWTALKRRC